MSENLFIKKPDGTREYFTPVVNRDDIIPAQGQHTGEFLTTDGSNIKWVPINAETLGAVPLTQKGQAGGVAELTSEGKVPASQLPSFVDDVLEFPTKDDFPAVGESDKIYVALDTNKIYRWSGTQYVEIAAGLTLGETSSTAYRGDRGKIAYEHSLLIEGNPHHVTKEDVALDRVNNTNDLEKPVSVATWEQLDKKLDVKQGAQYYGNILSVNSYGNIETSDTIDGGTF